MPQMAPMWWLSIMTLALIIVMTFMMMNYFSFNKKIETNFKVKNYKINWKW